MCYYHEVSKNDDYDECDYDGDVDDEYEGVEDDGDDDL